MIIALVLAGWLLAGLALALLVGGAVRLAEARRPRPVVHTLAEVEDLVAAA